MQLLHIASVALLAAGAAASAVLGERRTSMRGGVDAQALERDLNAAMGEAMGCGGQVDERHLLRLEQKLRPMWRTLPKNDAGNLDRRSLRYLVHRHFSRESALHIRGFEPSRPANASGWGGEDILSQRVPAFVESVLESQHRLERGFTLADAAQMVATLEQLIFDDEGALLEQVYKEQRRAPKQSLDRKGVELLLESYMIHWMMGDDQAAVNMLLRNRTLLTTAIPHWPQLVAWAHGHASALDHRRETSPAAAFAEDSARTGHNAFAQKYSFEDVHRMTGGITHSFASFWDSECASMKSTLLEMDTHHTGRVPLSKFYGTGLDEDWRFGESEEYLRELGALDETSWRGKQVIIPNYLQAASNCIVTASHYLVCCANDCEILLDEIESKVAAPTARPEAILAIVRNMSSQSTLDDDAPPQLDASLVSQLEQIAEAHSGEVPIHGRLFAQWLHYVFPRECPFPHKSGAVATTTPMEYGLGFAASGEEMQKYATDLNATAIPDGMSKEELQWMSQWSPEEELISEQANLRLRAPWEGSASAGALLVIVAVLLSVAGASRAGKARPEAGLLPYHAKAHFV